MTVTSRTKPKSSRTPQKPLPTMNPLAELVTEGARPIWQTIERTADAFTGNGVIDFNPSAGLVRDRDHPSGYREATDKECERLKVEFTISSTIDIRSNLPANVATVLRDWAARLMSAAEAIEEIEDTRTIDAITLPSDLTAA